MIDNGVAVQVLLPTTPVQDNTQIRILTLLGPAPPHNIGYRVGSANPFDQSLNTTDSVAFQGLTLSAGPTGNTQYFPGSVTTSSNAPTTIVSLTGNASSEMAARIVIAYHIIPWIAGGGGAYESSISALFDNAAIPVLTGPFSILNHIGAPLVGIFITVSVVGSAIVINVNGLPGVNIRWSAMVTSVRSL